MLFLLSLLACESTPQNENPIEVPNAPENPEPEVDKPPTAKKTTEKKAPPLRTSVYISEVMAFPSKTDKFRGEWIELTNPTNQAISLDGFSIQSNDDSGFTFEAGTSIPKGEQLLLAVRKSPTGNGGLPKVDAVYKNTMIKINATDWIELKQGDIVIDRLEFNKGDIPNGKSLQIMPDKSTCEGATPYGDGDLGTPNKPNQCG